MKYQDDKELAEFQSLISNSEHWQQSRYHWIIQTFHKPVVERTRVEQQELRVYQERELPLLYSLGLLTSTDPAKAKLTEEGNDLFTRFEKQQWTEAMVNAFTGFLSQSQGSTPYAEQRKQMERLGALLQTLGIISDDLKPTKEGFTSYIERWNQQSHQRARLTARFAQQAAEPPSFTDHPKYLQAVQLMLVPEPEWKWFSDRDQWEEIQTVFGDRNVARWLRSTGLAHMNYHVFDLLPKENEISLAKISGEPEINECYYYALLHMKSRGTTKLDERAEMALSFPEVQQWLRQYQLVPEHWQGYVAEVSPPLIKAKDRLVASTTQHDIENPVFEKEDFSFSEKEYPQAKQYSRVKIQSPESGSYLPSRYAAAQAIQEATKHLAGHTLLLELVVPKRAIQKKRFREQDYTNQRMQITEKTFSALTQKIDLSMTDQREEQQKQLHLFTEEVSDLHKEIAEKIKKQVKQMVLKNWQELNGQQQQFVLNYMQKAWGAKPRSIRERLILFRGKSMKTKVKKLLTRASGEDLQFFLRDHHQLINPNHQEQTRSLI